MVEIPIHHEFTDPTQRIAVSRFMLDENSVGFKMFPGSLEGKERAVGALIKPYDSEHFYGHQVNTVIDLLNTPEEITKGIHNKRGKWLEPVISDIYNNLNIGPEGFLIHDIARQTPEPISVESEIGRHEAVAAFLYRAEHGDLLDLYYGISTGVRMRSNQIAEAEGLEEATIRLWLKNTMMNLRHGIAIKELKRFIANSGNRVDQILK